MPTSKDYLAVFIIGAVIAATIIVMSSFFLVKALKRAKTIGMTSDRIKTVIKSSAVFSIVPSIPIVIGIGVMMTFLGLAIPWIRLTVIGALQYELIAMDSVGLTASSDAAMIASALVIMTISILAGPLFNVIFYKKYQGKLVELEKTNKPLLDTITGSLLGGIVAGLASYIIIAAIFNPYPEAQGTDTTTGNGYLTLITLGISMVTMALCGLGMKLFKWKWMENYALPISMLVAMASAYAMSYLPVFC